MDGLTKTFYREQHEAWRGPWQLPLTGDSAADLTNRLLKAVGEPPVNVLVITEGEYHQAFVDRIEYLAMEITPLIVIHEVAHVVQVRNDGWYCPDHDEDLWAFMGVLSCVLEELL